MKSNSYLVNINQKLVASQSPQSREVQKQDEKKQPIQAQPVAQKTEKSI